MSDRTVLGDDQEQARLQALYDLQILDTPREPDFDDVVSVAATICRAPIAVINFIDADRQWSKACVGLESAEAPRAASFCATTIGTADGVLVVPDTRRDPVWADNPQVTGSPGLRFYAGAVVRSANGEAVGSLCVADTTRPRAIGARELDALSALSRQTGRLLTLREHARKLGVAYRQLREIASTDPLTGAVNRTMLEHSLGLALRQRARTGRDLGVLFCDVDGLKATNDQHGHSAGDELLRGVVERLTAAARTADLIARFGGDEFVVMCPGLAGPEDLEQIAQRLRATVAESLRAGDETLHPRLSIGLALAREGDDADTLIARADTDMYRDKRAREHAPQ